MTSRIRFLGEPLSDGGKRLHTRDCVHRARGSHITSVGWISGMRSHLDDKPKGPAFHACPLCRPLGPFTDAYETELRALAEGKYGPEQARDMRRWVCSIAETALTCMEVTLFDRDTGQ